MPEQCTSAKLTLLITTSHGVTINREFRNYAELFDYGVAALSDLPGGHEMYTHTQEQWSNRGQHCTDFSSGNQERVEISADEYHRLLNIERAARELMTDEEVYIEGATEPPRELHEALGLS